MLEERRDNLKVGTFMKHMPNTRKHLENQSGQAMAETAISLGIIVLMMLGTVEFGRAFMVTNAIANAVRVGARAAAMEPSSNRDTSGMIVNKTAIIASVRSEISAVLGATVANAMQIQVTQPAGSLPKAQVSVTGTVPYIFRIVGPSFSVARTVSYRDQMR